MYNITSAFEELLEQLKYETETHEIAIVITKVEEALLWYTQNEKILRELENDFLLR